MDLLLVADEPLAVEVRNGDGLFIVVCEHASNRIPRSLIAISRGIRVRSKWPKGLQAGSMGR